jgi:phenylalanyl-tRNA synthetase beta chain
MKATLNWLKQYVEFEWSAEELTERLTMLGLEVEGVQKLTGEFQGVVVAQVITRDNHPNADKLSLCRVNDGKGERQIVCGADNFKAGDKVPLILPGNTLPAKPGESPLTIKVGKIRGVESHGMLCSPQELGLGEVTQGLLILHEEAKVGQAFAEYLGRSSGDVVYDLEITPNRPDLNSVIGIAREISAVTGNPLRLPDVTIPPENKSSQPGPGIQALVGVKIEDPDLCPRYTARIIRGVKIGPSPDWLRSTLEKVGVRTISNVVDVTNYVMLETGEPLHAFDYHLLQPSAQSAHPTIVVRRAAVGEKFKTLDDQERTLTDQMLLIADETKAIALAGVMGGLNTEINNQTADVLIESACFKPRNIRATSKKLELRTESSYRFERGTDIELCDWASRRAAQLILQTAGGVLVEGAIDNYPGRQTPRQIGLRPDRTSALLGIDLPVQQQTDHLKSLGLQIDDVTGSGSSSVFQIPSWRPDLKGEIDLIEEIARLHGIEKIPATPPRGAIGSNAYDAIHDQLAEARRILSAMGLFEAQGQTLISDATLTNTADALVLLANPLSSDMNALRPSLLPGLLSALKHNLNHRNGDVALFELGRAFLRSSGQQPAKGKDAAKAGEVVEQRRIAIGLTGLRNAPFWTGEDREAQYDLHDLKGMLEEFFEEFGVRGISFVRRDAPTSLFVESAAITMGKTQVGELGQLLPAIARQHALRDAALLAEINLDLMLSRRNASRSFKALPDQPSVRRDVAMIVPEATTHESVLQIVRQTRPANLESVELFDVFRGMNVPTGQKSLAYAFTYRSPERSLTDPEVNSVHEKLIALFKDRLQATVRE